MVFFYKQFPLALLLGVFAPCCMADNGGLATTVNANIVDNSCTISLDNGGNVDLGLVSTAAINAGPAPVQYTSGGRKFSITVKDCADWEGGTISRLHFSFSPQSGAFPDTSHQIFINETPVDAGGANSVGVVIFALQNMQNVLNAGGSSDVTYSYNPDDVVREYPFEARFQKSGDSVSAGKVHSSVIVSAYYD